MKKKLLDRRGAAIELAIMMMVFSIFITTIVLTTALLQNTHKAKAELGIRQDILLEQLGDEFVEAVRDNKVDEWVSKHNSGNVTAGEFKPHNWDTEVIRATCTENGKEIKTCKDCGKQEVKIIEAQGHNAIIKQPTCTEVGSMGGKCSRCTEEIEKTEIPMLEHDVPIIKQATCTTKGIKGGQCTMCAAVIEEVEIPLADHAWEEEGVITKYATCMSPGEKTYYCKEKDNGCLATYIEAIPALAEHEWEEKSKTEGCTITTIYSCKWGCEGTHKELIEENHTWGPGGKIVGKTCADEDGMLFKCAATGCKATKTERIPHGEWELAETIDAKCTEAGWKIWVCVECGTTRKEAIPATGHDFSDGRTACANCGVIGGYTLTVITAGKNSYLFDIKEIGPGTTESDGTETGGEESVDVCSAGGTVVLRVTVAQFGESYKITEWSKK